LQHFPDNADTLQVSKGTAILIKKDIFRNLMWYILPDSSKQYPLTIDRVKKIKSDNMKSIVPHDLEAVEVTSSKPKEVEPEFVDVVGQISLKTLEKSEKRKRANNPQPPRRDSRPPQKQGGGNQGQDRRGGPKRN
jgi:hypothetical protein